MSKRVKRTPKSFLGSERQLHTEAVKESSSTERNWNDMTYDVLIKIFLALHVADLASISLVSRYWRQACSDPATGFWNKLDLSRLSSKSMTVPKEYNAWSDEYSSKKMTQFLNNALSLSNGKTSCLIFPFFLCITDVHLISAAERSPNLKRLVLPGSGHLSKMGIDGAMRLWGGLESMNIPINFKYYDHFLTAIGKYCKNFNELKIGYGFNVELADALVKHTPNLKVLSLRTILVDMTALSRVLNCLEHLEVVNICHSLILDLPEGDFNSARIYRIQDLANHLNALCLQKLITCESNTCLRCNSLPSGTHANMIPVEFHELLWREDEISSLAH